MIQLDIHDSKLQEYLERLPEGEPVLLCKGDVPIAEVRPLPEKPRKRTIGWYKGRLEIPDEFFHPLPEDLLAAFNGEHD